MRILLALLTRFFRLAAGPEDESAAPDPAPTTEPEPEDPTLDDLLENEEPPSTVREPEETVETLRARARALEEQLRQERETRYRAPAPERPVGRDPREEAEEREYAEAKARGADQAYLDNLAWRNGANKALRDSDRNSRSALAEAKDIADRTEFAGLAASQPKLYAKYREQVEQAAQQAKANGSPIPRMVLLDLAVGRALREGKSVKTTKPKTSAAAPAAERIDRGRSPLAGARTDVAGGGKEKLSKLQELERKLTGVRI